MSFSSGMIQIWSRWTGSESDALNSLWVTPVPALILWTLPGRMVEPLPMLSLWASAPLRTYVMISMSR